MTQRVRPVAVTCVALVAAVAGAVPVLLADTGAERADAVAVALAVVAYLLVGVLLCVSRPGERVAWLLLAGAMAWGTGEGLLAVGLDGVREGGAAPAPVLVAVLGTAVRGLGWLALVVLLPLIFPDGRPPWTDRRWPLRLALAGLAGFATACLLSPTPLEARMEDVDNPLGLPGSLRAVTDVLALGSLATLLVALGAALAGLAHRWRSGGPLVRQQVLLFGLAFAVPLFFLPVIATELARPWMFALVVLPVPVATAVALLQRRLYDIHLVVGRGLALVGLSASVALLYAATVGGVGALLGARGAPWLGWLGAGVVAVSFAPLRDSLQRAANRLVHGRWADPGEVLADTARRVADTTDPAGLLDSLTTEVAEGLGLEAVWVSDESGVVARDGAPVVPRVGSTSRPTDGRSVGSSGGPGG